MASLQQKLDVTAGADNQKNQSAPQLSTADAKFRDMLQAAIEGSAFGSTDPVTRHFRRKADKGDKARYEKCGDDIERKAFRKEWAQREYDRLTCSRHYMKEYQKVNRELGEYLCLESIAEKVGYVVNPKKAIQKAFRYSYKCAALGGSWIRWCSMMEQFEFLWLRRQYSEQLQEAWQFKQTEQSEHPQAS